MVRMALLPNSGFQKVIMKKIEIWGGHKSLSIPVSEFSTSFIHDFCRGTLNLIAPKQLTGQALLIFDSFN